VAVTAPTASSAACSTLASEFERHRRQLIQQKSHVDGNGWRAELRRYLSDLPSDVSKDMDIVKWWSDHVKTYPTLAHIAKDVCSIPATSVPCEWRFSAGAEIATDQRSRLGADKFKKLQIMKHAWRDKVNDQATINSLDCEEEVLLEDFKDLWARESEINGHEQFSDETVSL
jgi:hypothetical protein